MPPLRPCFTSSALLLLAACGTGDDPLPTAAAAIGRAPAHLFLLPPPAARVGTPLRLGLHRGNALDAARLRELPAFDPFVLRVGGFQENALQVDDVDGVGATVTPTQAGDTLVGCSTRPAPGTCDGESVVLVHHAKTLFFVSRDGVESPAASAALTNRIGLDLEIVPMIDPLPLRPGDRLPLQVHFLGETLVGAPVVVRWGEAAAQLESSDDVGAVHVPVAAGPCLVTVVHDPVGTGAGRTVHSASLTFRVGSKR